MNEQPDDVTTKTDETSPVNQRHDTLPTVAKSEPVAVRTSAVKSDRELKKARWLQRIFTGIVILVLGFGGGWLGARSHNEANTATDTQRIVLDEQGDLISEIAKEVGQSVVSVNVTSQSNASNYPFDFFDVEGREQQSAGTGIIISEEGLIVTNRHVVPEGTTEVSVVLSDGTEYENVQVVGRTNANDSLDIAFLQIENLGATKLKAAKIGNSSDMVVGESVIAIGNALGQFQNTVTTGIISGYGRSVYASTGGLGGENLDDLFQTDAAINQGNSGGPLVNLKGEVIGINTAVADAAENIGFSIPVDNIKGLIKSVSTTGELQRPYLGIVYVGVTGELVSEYGLKVKEGAFIPPAEDYGRDTVIDGAPADTAGLQEGDVITKIEDKEITESVGLASILGQYTSGETIDITVNRNGTTEVIQVTLGTMPRA